MNTNHLIIITLIIAGFLFNYWEIRKNSHLISTVVTHLKELRLSNYPKKNIVSDYKPAPISNSDIAIPNKHISQADIDNIINYEVNSNDTEELENEILNYELELEKLNKKDDDIISNSNISLDNIKCQIDSNINNSIYSNVLDDNIVEESMGDNVSVEKTVEDCESMGDNVSVEKTVEDCESMGDNVSMEETVEDCESMGDNVLVEETVEDCESMGDNVSVEEMVSVVDNVSVEETILVVKPDSVEETVSVVKSKLKRNKDTSDLDLENTINTLKTKYKFAELETLCVANKVAGRKTKTQMIKNLLRNNITI
uniref:Uncharacterized protein n=1 Tax=viral metagenome TaxID=1070528 RepID=A0A6C0EJT8_9ZZZZ